MVNTVIIAAISSLEDFYFLGRGIVVNIFYTRRKLELRNEARQCGV